MPPVEPDGGAVVADGFILRRTWGVWSNEVQHRVDVALNSVTGSARVSVDGTEVARRSMWHMDMSGFALPFDVAGRPCQLVVRSKYGAQPSFELYSDGRSLTTGETLAEHRESQTRELPNLVRMFLIFIPLIGGFNSVVLRGDPLDGALGAWGPVAFIGFGVVVAAAGWWLASLWYGRGPTGTSRHLVGGAIVAVAWLVFFAGYVAMLSVGSG
jgi:hypothetical protein